MSTHGMVISMHTTKVFRNGNSQAMRIPAELSYERTDMVLCIERVGDELRIRPAPQALAGPMAGAGMGNATGMRSDAALHARHQYVHLPDEASARGSLSPLRPVLRWGCAHVCHHFCRA